MQCLGPGSKVHDLTSFISAMTGRTDTVKLKVGILVLWRHFKVPTVRSCLFIKQHRRKILKSKELCPARKTNDNTINILLNELCYSSSRQILAITIYNTDKIIVMNKFITYISARFSYFIRKYSTGLWNNNIHIPIPWFSTNWRILVKLGVNFVS
jgi:hypothetical protein